MKVQLLPSTFESGGRASGRQHLTTLVLNDVVALDAGSLAMASSNEQKASIRDVIISHAHLDHVAGLPLFIDDLFATLTEPVRIHATAEVIEVLEEHIFNWKIYPRFSELVNDFGSVTEYVKFQPGGRFDVRGLTVVPIEVEHKVQSCGFIVSDDAATIAITGDTAPTDCFWSRVNALPSVRAILIECAFPNELSELASLSFHMTPKDLGRELGKLERNDCDIYVTNIKPAYRDETVSQISDLKVERLNVLEVGRIYEW